MTTSDNTVGEKNASLKIPIPFTFLLTSRANPNAKASCNGTTIMAKWNVFIILFKNTLSVSNLLKFSKPTNPISFGFNIL